MIKLISSKVARILCKDEKHTDNYELYEYAIYIILSSAFHMATVIVLGLVFNLLTESLLCSHLFHRQRSPFAEKPSSRPFPL